MSRADHLCNPVRVHVDCRPTWRTEENTPTLYEVWFIVIGNDGAVVAQGEPWTFGGDKPRRSRHGAVAFDDQYALDVHVHGQTCVEVEVEFTLTNQRAVVRAPTAFNWVRVDVVQIEEPLACREYPEFVVSRRRACGTAPLTGEKTRMLRANDVLTTHLLEQLPDSHFYDGQCWVGNENETRVLAEENKPWHRDAEVAYGVMVRYTSVLNSEKFTGSWYDIHKTAVKAGTDDTMLRDTVRLPYWLTNPVSMHVMGPLMGWGCAVRSNVSWVMHVFRQMFLRRGLACPATLRNDETGRRQLMRAARAWALTRPYVADRIRGRAGDTPNDVTTWPTDTGANDCEDFAMLIVHVFRFFQRVHRLVPRGDTSRTAIFVRSVSALANRYEPLVVFGLLHNPTNHTWGYHNFMQAGNTAQRFAHSFAMVVEKPLFEYWLSDGTKPKPPGNEVHKYVIDSVSYTSVTKDHIDYAEPRASIYDRFARAHSHRSYHDNEVTWFSNRESFADAVVDGHVVTPPRMVDIVLSAVADDRMPLRFACKAEGCHAVTMQDLWSEPLNHRLEEMKCVVSPKERDALRRLVTYDRPHGALLTSASKRRAKRVVAELLRDAIWKQVGENQENVHLRRPSRSANDDYDRVLVNVFVRSSHVVQRYPRYGTTLKQEGINEVVRYIRAAGVSPAHVEVFPDMGRVFLVQVAFRVERGKGDGNYRA